MARTCKQRVSVSTKSKDDSHVCDDPNSLLAGDGFEVHLFQFSRRTSLVLADRTAKESLTNTSRVHHMEHGALLLSHARDKDGAAERSEVPIESVIVHLTAVPSSIKK